MPRQEERSDAVAGDLFDGREDGLMAALSAAEESVTELCEDFGISRKTAYKWWRRYLRAAQRMKELRARRR